MYSPDHILLKDVGKHVSKLEKMKDDFPDVKKLLMDFMKKPKSISPCMYLLIHHLERELKNKTVDIDHEINSL
jgi:hypothetical protein